MFTLIPEEMIQFDKYFQSGWNHHLEMCGGVIGLFGKVCFLSRDWYTWLVGVDVTFKGIVWRISRDVCYKCVLVKEDMTFSIYLFLNIFIPGPSKCVKFMPFHQKNLPKGRNFTYLEDPGIFHWCGTRKKEQSNIDRVLIRGEHLIGSDQITTKNGRKSMNFSRSIFFPAF